MAFLDLPAALDPALRVLPELAVKAALVLAVAGLAAAALRRASASARHLVWAVAILGVLALPLGQLVPVRFGVLPSFLAQPAGSGTVDPAPSSRTSAAATDVTPMASAPTPSVDAASPTPAASTPSVTPSPSSSARTWSLGGWGWARVLVAVWLVGAALLVLRLAIGTATVWWLARTGERIDDEEWTLAADRISRAFDAPSARLVRSRWTEMPMTWGVLRPVVLLPANADEWPAERRDVVLRHELAHVARRDVATLAIAQLACAVHWFNPLSWIALHQLRAEAEKCCDDWVLRGGTRASTYADHLLEMVRIIGRARVPAALALPMAQRSTFEGRLLAILEPGVERGTVRRRQALLTTAGLAALVVTLGAMRPAEAAVAEPAIHGDASIGRTEASIESPALRSEANAPVSAGLARDERKEAARLVDAGVLDRLPPSASAAVEALASGTASTAQARQERSTAVTALIGAIRDSNVEVRVNAIMALGSLNADPRSVQALIQALRTDPDAEVRKVAAWALGQIEDRAATSALVQAMASDRSVEVRRTATWALGQIEDPAAVDGLVRAMRDSDPEVRKTAVWALGQIEDRRAVAPLTEALREGDVEVRRDAAWALGQIEAREAVPALSAALRDGDREVRETAVWALGEIEDPSAVPALSGVLRDSDPRVRSQAVWALGQIEAESAVTPLASLLASDDDVGVRENAAWALGQIEAKSSVPALSAALRDRAPRVRVMAAWALGQVEPDQAPEALTGALRDDNVDVRRIAAWALGQIEDPSTYEALRGALRDADAQVKRSALRALATSGDEAAASAAAELLRDADPQMRAAAAAALAGHGNVDPRPMPRPQPRPRPRPRPFF